MRCATARSNRLSPNSDSCYRTKCRRWLGRGTEANLSPILPPTKTNKSCRPIVFAHFCSDVWNSLPLNPGRLAWKPKTCNEPASDKIKTCVRNFTDAFLCSGRLHRDEKALELVRGDVVREASDPVRVQHQWLRQSGPGRNCGIQIITRVDLDFCQPSRINW